MADPEMKITNSNDVNVDNYRKLVQTYISLHTYHTALFWADKVVTLTCNNPRDVYWLAQCMYLLKQYHRAAHLLRSRNLDKMYVLCNNLTVRCLLEANELNEALKVLNSMDMEVFLQNTSLRSSGIESGMFDDTPRHQVQSSVLLLKGKVLEAMDNRGLASDCYRQALQCDVHCFEAFESLIKHHMLTAGEENDLVNSLPISKQCTPDETEILLILYKSKLKKYHMPSQVLPITLPLVGQVLSFPETPECVPATNSTPSYNPVITNYVSTPIDKNSIERKKENDEVMNVEEGKSLLARLQENLDLVVAQAEKLYYNCDYQRCNIVTEKILKQDPYHSACLPIHISCLVELKQSNKLFTLAHNLVDLYPNLAISWYAVGCYYYVIGKSDSARRYLAKATSLDRLFGPAWLAYGHSFAIENEHDQAMAAYFKASQLMKGCHLPLLYIGLECGLTNNEGLATKFFQQAIKIAPNDPFVLHEMGIIAFQTLNYASAEKCYRDALKIVRKNNGILLPERWAPLLNNLGHTLRRQRKYEEALECHHEALVLCPQVASTYSAIAYVHSLTGNLIEAVDWFHRALGLKRDDTFSTTMLNYVLEHLSEDETPYPGAPDNIPDFHVEPKQDGTSVQDILDESESPVTTAPNLEALDMSMCIEVDMPDISGIIKE